MDAPLGARRLTPGTLVPRSVSGSCRVLRASPWSAPFPPPPPPTLSPVCSAASLVLRHSPTPPRRTRPACGYSPSRTGPALRDAKEVSRFSCMLFLGVPGVLDFAGPDVNSRSNAPRQCGLPADSKGSAPGSWYSELNSPAHRCLCLRFTCRLAATGARLQVKMESLLLSCRALSSPTTCRFIPAHAVPHFPFSPTPPCREPWYTEIVSGS